jgi:rhodanese-related sulfurtransferase
MSGRGVPEISVAEAHALLRGPNPPRLIDVREEDEWTVARIPGAELLPLSQWPSIVLDRLTDKSQALLIQCHHGGRSARATAWLLEQGFSSVTNLAGGIDAWSAWIDPSVPRYQ